MFVQTVKSLTLITALALLTGTANAEGDNLSVELSGLQASQGKLFISIQKEEDFMATRGEGGVFEITASGNETFAFDVDPGVYAVSVWHDTDNDGRFSMDDNWVPTDGWAMSGTPGADKAPAFNDVKIEVSAGQTSVSLPMIYPG